MAIKLADTARPNNYVDAEHLGTYPVAYAEDVWFADGTRLSEKTFDGQSIQKEELPLASANEVGNIYQYTGTTGTYKNGFFYRCVSDGEPSPTYSWEEIKYVDKPVVYSDTVPNIEKYDMGAIVCYTGEDIPPFQKGHLYIKETRQMNMYDYIASVIGMGHGVVYSFKEKRDVAVNDVTYTENIVGGYHYFVANGYIESITNDEYARVVYNSTQTTITDKPVFERTKSNANVVDWYDIGGGSGGNSFIGTKAEWDALSQTEKDEYDGKIVNITDDTVSATVVDSVTPNDMNPVTSNAVADCTGYIDTMMLVGDEFDTTYQDGSSSAQYHITDGLYRVHVYLYNPTNEKTSNRCLIQRYENGTAKATLFDFNYTGSGAIQQQNYIRVKSGTIGVTHEASGGGVGGRCYFVLHKVSESH